MATGITALIGAAVFGVLLYAARAAAKNASSGSRVEKLRRRYMPNRHTKK